MPSPKKLLRIIRSREAMVEKVPAHFVQAIERVQNNLNRQVIEFVKDMKTSGGRLERTPANIRMANTMRRNIRKWLRQSGYYEEVSSFSKQYKGLMSLSRDYYREMDLPGSFTARDTKHLSQLRRDDVNFLLANDERVINTTYNELVSSVYQQRSFSDLTDALRKINTDTVAPNGARTQGLLKRYGATYANTAFAGFDRQMQNIKAKELGLDQFLFSGGLLQDSRDFCVERAGRVFTNVEVESWQYLSWKGKAGGRNVWTYLGGWNCQHVLSPVTEEMAAEIVNIKPTPLNSNVLETWEADKLGKSFLDKVAKVEPGVTKELKGLAKQYDGEMVGLQYKVKGAGSLRRKLLTESYEKGLLLDQIATENANDVLRYTMLVDDAKYSKNSMRVLGDLKSKGHDVLKVKNYWGSDYYKGVNVVMRDKSGQKWELQFHTPESLRIKEKIVHPMYEEHRLLTTSLARKKALEAKMTAAWKSLDIPPGIKLVDILKLP